MTDSPAVYRRRRIMAIVALAVLAAVLVFAVTRLAGSDAAEPRQAAGGADAESATPAPEKPAELPRGGRSILPEFRVVAYYGAAQDKQLGALGVGSPAQAARKL